MTSTEPSEKKAARADTPPPSRLSRLPAPLRRVIDFASSLKLTVVFLSLGLLLVFIGTLAQVDEGLYAAQNRYFRSFFVWWGPHGATWKLPVFPGGYLVGTVLLVNLFAAHARRFKLSANKIGITIIHSGLVLLLLGQLATDMLSTESSMRLEEGETKSYSENGRLSELVLIDTSGAQGDRVYSVSEKRLAKGGEIRDARLPFVLRVKNYWPNASIFEEPPIKANIPAGSLKPQATAGLLKDDYVLPQPLTTDMDLRDVPAAVVEVVGEADSTHRSYGSFLVYSGVSARQSFTVDGKSYEIALRFARYYKPYSIQLLNFTHERYKGTDIPKNFASRVRVENQRSKEAREVLIYMNTPLRYEGTTFYQAGFDPNNDRLERKVTILQVVENPGWLTPYLSCVLVGLGLVTQFLMHLVKFVTKRRSA
jgi:hypothetical protein